MYGWRKPKVRFVNCCGIGRYRAELGAASRQWMEDLPYYQEAAMVEHYRRAYLDLFEALHRFHVRRFVGHSEPWLAVALPNHRWAARKRANSPWRMLADAVRGR
ncbi:MAG: hypothetical protein CBARDMAM_0942 [uncultured Caballeronia sp.]|nr:MAG: hypothetical protein CBARDMAM_0942 [uncultured Caballeronia sp.]